MLTWLYVSVCCRYNIANVNVTTQPVPSSTTTAKPSWAGFDVASFLGGIILGAGIVVISLVGWRCYQHRRHADVPYNAMAQ